MLFIKEANIVKERHSESLTEPFDIFPLVKEAEIVENEGFGDIERAI